MLPSQPTSLQSMQRLSIIALMAAFISSGALFHIAIGPVPITLQDFFIMLTGFLLGPRYGVIAVGTYLLAGAIGLPVFSGGRGGLGHFLGNTGGYLVGYLFLAFFAGMGSTLASHVTKCNITTMPLASKQGVLFYAICLAGGLVGLVCMYTLGTVWLAFRMEISLSKAFAIGVLPFIPIGIPKVIFAALLGCALRKKKLLTLI